MAYDRDEWRTPWRVADDTDPTAAGPAAAPQRPSAGPDGETGTDTSGADAPSSTADAVAGGATTERSGGPGAGRGTADVGATAPIARFPQPPPSGWDPTAAGPGSPPGSVRPPDTTGTHDAPAARRRGRTLLGAGIIGLVGALIGGGLVVAVVGGVDAGPMSDTRAPEISVDGETSTAVVPTVAEAVLPSVVSIDVPAAAVDAPAGPGGQAALGSGVIYRSDGFILTNAHVVGDAEEVNVRLASGDVLAAEVVGSDELNDLAVLEADLPEDVELPAINLRDADEDLVVGETVVAIGSPFGLEGSVTSGIVSGLNRDLTVGEEDGAGLTIPSVIQTDAAINPGNSGGALVDASGRLVGINTAILTRTGGNQGVGFAVPAGQATTSADQIIEQGFVRHPLLGITGLDVSPEIAEEFGLEAPRGAVVDSVQPDTGAEDAGVEPGDIIVEVDGEPLATMSQLVSEVRQREPGEALELGIVRDGERLDLEVTLTERPRD